MNPLAAPFIPVFLQPHEYDVLSLSSRFTPPDCRQYPPLPRQVWDVAEHGASSPHRPGRENTPYDDKPVLRTSWNGTMISKWAEIVSAATETLHNATIYHLTETAARSAQGEHDDAVHEKLTKRRFSLRMPSKSLRKQTSSSASASPSKTPTKQTSFSAFMSPGDNSKNPTSSSISVSPGGRAFVLMASDFPPLSSPRKEQSHPCPVISANGQKRCGRRPQIAPSLLFNTPDELCNNRQGQRS